MPLFAQPIPEVAEVRGRTHELRGAYGARGVGTRKDHDPMLSALYTLAPEHRDQAVALHNASGVVDSGSRKWRSDQRWFPSGASHRRALGMIRSTAIDQSTASSQAFR